MQYKIRHKKLLSLMLGGISSFVFAPYFMTVLGIMCFSGLMYLLLQEKHIKKLFALGYWFGFGHFACGFSWICNALLVEPEKFGFLVPITIIASGGFFGLFAAIPAMVINLADKKWQKWLIFGISWAFFEWVRGWFLTGFPWNLLGYSFGFSDSLMQIAAVGGSYLLSLIAVLGYSVWGLVFTDFSKKKAVIVTVGIGLIFGVMVFFGNWRLSNANLEESGHIVRIVQPSIKQKMKWDESVREDNLRQYLNLSAKKTVKMPDLIVWGETASPFVLDRDKKHLEQTVKVIPKKGYLISGMISFNFVEGNWLPYNSMVAINDKGEFESYYHKSHLVPFGEYIPLREYLPEFIKPVANAIGSFGKGNGPEKIMLKGLPSLGGVICYEIIFPHEVIDQNNRPEFLINVTNDGWYGDSAGIYQHWLTARFRAVEEGIEIIRAANSGISGLINPYGQEIKKMGLNYKGFIDVNLHKKLNQRTIYSIYGNKIFLIFCLLLGILCIITASGSKLKIKYFF